MHTLHDLTFTSDPSLKAAILGGADVNTVDERTLTPLHLAVLHRQAECTKVRWVVVDGGVRLVDNV